jgi:hypothetical protein
MAMGVSKSGRPLRELFTVLAHRSSKPRSKLKAFDGAAHALFASILGEEYSDKILQHGMIGRIPAEV